MSFSSEIRAKLGLDTSGFSAKIPGVLSETEKLGGEMGKTLQRKLGAVDVFKGLLQGLGIGSAQQIADMLVKPFREAADAARDVEQSIARTYEVMARGLGARRSPEQNLAFGERELQREMKVAEGMQKRVNELQGSRANRALQFLGAETPELSEARRALSAQNERVQTLYESNEALRRSIREQNRALQENSVELMDQERLVRGQIDEAEALRRAQWRAQLQRQAAEREFGISSGRAIAARNAEMQAGLAILRAERKVREQIVALYSAREAAAADVASRRAALASAQRERTTATIGELVSGARGSSRDQFLAREVQRLEAKARDEADRGFFEMAADTLAVADRRRLQITNLANSERDLVAAQKEALKTSEEKLQQIVDRLANTNIR